MGAEPLGRAAGRDSKFSKGVVEEVGEDLVEEGVTGGGFRGGVFMELAQRREGDRDLGDASFRIAGSSRDDLDVVIGGRRRIGEAVPRGNNLDVAGVRDMIPFNRRSGVFGAGQSDGGWRSDLIFRNGGGQRERREDSFVVAFERLAFGVDAIDAEPVGFADIETGCFDRGRREAGLVIRPRFAVVLGELNLVGYGAGDRGP